MFYAVGIAVDVDRAGDPETLALLHVVECIYIILFFEVVPITYPDDCARDLADQLLPVDLPLVLRNVRNPYFHPFRPPKKSAR